MYKVTYSDYTELTGETKNLFIIYLIRRLVSAEGELGNILINKIKSKHIKEHGDYVACHDLSDPYTLIEGMELDMEKGFEYV